MAPTNAKRGRSQANTQGDEFDDARQNRSAQVKKERFDRSVKAERLSKGDLGRGEAGGSRRSASQPEEVDLAEEEYDDYGVNDQDAATLVSAQRDANEAEGDLAVFWQCFSNSKIAGCQQGRATKTNAIQNPVIELTTVTFPPSLSWHVQTQQYQSQLDSYNTQTVMQKLSAAVRITHAVDHSLENLTFSSWAPL